MKPVETKAARITNIAAYKFAVLPDIRELRARIMACCRQGNLKGTILLSPEGINLFVAGFPESVDRLLAEVRGIPGLADLQPKFSTTDRQPFTRMLVRLKKEIIAFGVDGIDPAKRTSPKLSARELKRWLDEGRPVTLLDTRNDYEVKLGTFRNAVTVGIDHFRDFPAAVRRLPEGLKEQPIVMFCTGGIRCEKAGPFMEREGFQSVFQLDGGILNYFEECGGAHYDGECFVFDQRVGVDASLRETDSTQCFRCQSPLRAEDQADPRYRPGESCPFCHAARADALAGLLARRHEAVASAIDPLPGSRPYDNIRPLNIPAHCEGAPLAEALSRIVRSVPLETWTQACAAGLIRDMNRKPVPSERIVRAGERYLRRVPQIVEPDVNGRVTILHEDEALVVVNKPAPLPMHPAGRFNRNTLRHILDIVYAPQHLRPAHRLDANTTGVLLIARTRHFAGRLQPQFESGNVEKAYLARVEGWPVDDRFSCEAPISTDPGGMGSREVDPNGFPASTEFRVLRRDPDGSTLLEARPLTGRTNQIRIHLSHLGLPVRGDIVYGRHSDRAGTPTLAVADPPLCLHALSIRFHHPLTGERTQFTAPPPDWAQQFPSTQDAQSD